MQQSTTGDPRFQQSYSTSYPTADTRVAHAPTTTGAATTPKMPQNSHPLGLFKGALHIARSGFEDSRIRELLCTLHTYKPGHMALCYAITCLPKPWLLTAGVMHLFLCMMQNTRHSGRPSHRLIACKAQTQMS